MKLAILLPGHLDSPEYLHMKVFSKRLNELGYQVEIIDPCNIWETGDIARYTVTQYINDVKDVIDFYKHEDLDEVILIGHSLGGFVSIIAGNKYSKVSKVVALCSPATLEGAEKRIKVSKRDLPEDPKRFREFNVPKSFAEDAVKHSALDHISKLDKPIMVFIAMDDTTVPPEEIEKLVDSATDPYVIRQENMGHDFRHSKQECEIVMSEIEKFID